MLKLMLDAVPRAFIGALLYTLLLSGLYILGDLLQYRQLVKQLEKENGELQTQETQAAGQGSSSGEMDSTEVVN